MTRRRCECEPTPNSPRASVLTNQVPVRNMGSACRSDLHVDVYA